MITQAELKAAVHYCPETGVFTWIKARQKAKVGAVAGGPGKYGGKMYYRMGLNGGLWLGHRLAYLYMTGEMPSHDIDHIDGNGLNNAWANLRAVSRRENLKNQKTYRNNKSGVCGVHWLKNNGKWRSEIGSRGTKVGLGVFANLDDAIAARKAAEAQYGYHPNHGRAA